MSLFGFLSGIGFSSFGNSKKIESITNSASSLFNKFTKDNNYVCNPGNYVITINSDDSPILFQAMNDYYSKIEYKEILNHFNAKLSNNTNEINLLKFDLGYGENTLKILDSGECINIDRKLLNNNGYNKTEQIIISLNASGIYKKEHAQSQKRIKRNFFDRVESICNYPIKEYIRKIGNNILIYDVGYKGLWKLNENINQLIRTERLLESIILKDNYKDEIINKLNYFIEYKNSFDNKLHFLFHGKPGSGKTTLALGISTYIKIYIYLCKIVHIYA